MFVMVDVHFSNDNDRHRLHRCDHLNDDSLDDGGHCLFCDDALHPPHTLSHYDQ